MSANKNIQIKQYNGTDYDNLMPKTIGSNVSTLDGNTLEQHVTDTQISAWNGKQNNISVSAVAPSSPVVGDMYYAIV